MKHFDDIENFVKVMKMTKEELSAFRREQRTKLQEIDKELHCTKQRLLLERGNTLDTISILDLLLKET